MPAKNQKNKAKHEEVNQERYQLLTNIEDLLELPMIILGFIWLVLILIELLGSLGPFLRAVSNIIWVIFIVDFLLKFVLAPKKFQFLKSNILTIISLFVPALRVFRITRAFRVMGTLRAARGLRLVKMLSSINRGMRSLGASMSRRGFSYVFALTLLILFVGAAGMFAFEQDEKGGFSSYSEALWWTAMLLTSLGSEYWHKSPEGRTLCLILGLYGFAVFGYFTATLATFFIGRDAEDTRSEVAGSQQIEALRSEMLTLRKLLEKNAGEGSVHEES